MKYNEYRGIRCLVLAEITSDNGTYVAGNWERLSGVQALARNSTESSETHFYDNKPAIVIDAEGSDELTMTVSILANKTRARIDGVSYDEGTDMIVGTPKKKKYFAVGYIGEKTDGTEELNIFYKGKFTGGNETHNTKDDGTEATNVEYTYTGIHTSSNIYTENGTKTSAKNIKVPLTDKVTEASIFGEFDETGVSDKTVLTPDEIKALGA